MTYVLSRRELGNLRVVTVDLVLCCFESAWSRYW